MNYITNIDDLQITGSQEWWTMWVFPANNLCSSVTTLQPIVWCNIENYFSIKYAISIKNKHQNGQNPFRMRIIPQLINHHDDELLTLKVLKEVLFCFTFDIASVCFVQFFVLFLLYFLVTWGTVIICGLHSKNNAGYNH